MFGYVLTKPPGVEMTSRNTTDPIMTTHLAYNRDFPGGLVVKTLRFQ